jgi:hypothetical protein
MTGRVKATKLINKNVTLSLLTAVGPYPSTHTTGGSCQLWNDPGAHAGPGGGKTRLGIGGSAVPAEDFSFRIVPSCATWMTPNPSPRIVSLTDRLNDWKRELCYCFPIRNMRYSYAVPIGV